MAQKTVDLMLEHRIRVLDGIRKQLGPHGFDPDVTFTDWIMAFQRIANLSVNIEGDCTWSAPSHPKDMKTADWQRLSAALDQARSRFLETGDFNAKEGD